jgi:hypothetical protein
VCAPAAGNQPACTGRTNLVSEHVSDSQAQQVSTGNWTTAKDILHARYSLRSKLQIILINLHIYINFTTHLDKPYVYICIKITYLDLPKEPIIWNGEVYLYI